MIRKTIVTENAPQAIGPYSQGVRCGSMLFLSGQIALAPGSGELCGETAAEQTGLIMSNIKAVLTAAGCVFADVVKTTIYLTDLGDFQAVNEVYGSQFTAAPPARSTVEVRGLPRGAKVEIDVIAFCGD